ncbi:BTB/POZ domain-containing protein At1g30440-like [Selaginella moellendorffii]|uniref:BTB/POZ domain-containing protein At1g30440-like n=1 Tax=Selaginella moellendorffii TaxID=88036 RepID=UPI000D1CA4FF|nr:BTB/POZ domain-containing protein At1g30440-like [Selaginella moellendorffii]XP_024525383.1 BTB/POZ domain-containing protein At1g30440-like [Selaginella moellendorffii]|eukprot:XP_024525382.1 BTB/POZ domain-containing protein At1g30440-like [Selaginella moellendorffii]
MACMKLGSKADGFQRRGQAWFCTTGLPSDIVIEVEEMTFHLHKFPLMSRSGRLTRLVAELLDDDAGDGNRIVLPGVPGGAETFELAAKFCYAVKVELTSANAVALRCAAEYLEMTEEYVEGNLIAKIDSFLNQVVLKSWKDSVRALQSCEDVFQQAEELGIVKRCIDSIASKACTDPALFGWPVMEQSGSMQSPGGSVLWNGISTGAKPKNPRSDWWYEDVSLLSLPLYERVISAMEAKGIRGDAIAGALMYYAKKQLPGLSRRQDGRESGNLSIVPVTNALSENEQKVLLETIESLLPLQKGVVSTRFLFGLLRIAMILSANADCKSSLERRIGQQMEQASLDDLLMPNYSYTVETLYDIDTVQRILDHFLMMDQARATSSSIQSFEDGPLIGSPQLSPMMMVAKQMDNYLAEVAPDVNLKPAKFQSLAECLPEYARLMDDGLYRAIDIYLKAHPWLLEHERERICRIMDCQKLSLEACTHAAQNERLPLRVVVQVLFFEQLQLRTAIAGCFLVADNVDQSRPLRSSHLVENAGGVGHSSLQNGWASVIRENQVLKVDMDRMRSRVVELEKECTTMRQEIEKLGKGGKGPFGLVSRRFGCKTAKSQVSNSHEKVEPGVPFSAEISAKQTMKQQGQHNRSASTAH